MFEAINIRIKKLDILDIAMAKWSTLFAAIIIVKLFPQLLKVGYPALVVLMLALGARPLYRFWIKK